MKRNLNVVIYRNGDTIPQVTVSDAWANIKTGAWCYYDNFFIRWVIYNKVYKWYAVNDPRGLAPLGYHMPTDAEFITLSNCMGGDTIAGKHLKQIGFATWDNYSGIPNIAATNMGKFTALPGGERALNGVFRMIGLMADFWSSVQFNNLELVTRSRLIEFYKSRFYRSGANKSTDYSVR